MSYSKKIMKGYQSLTVPIHTIPKSVQQTIPIYRISEEGIFQIEKKKRQEQQRFDRAYLFVDTNYVTKSEGERETFLKLYCQFLNSLNVSFKIVIMNNNQNMDRIRQEVFIHNSDPAFEYLATDFNQRIKMGVKTGQNGMEQVKLFILTCDQDSIEQARDFFRTIEANLTANFNQMDSALIALDAKERLRCLHHFYRFGAEENFQFDYQALLHQGADWRDSICCLAMKHYRNEAGKPDGETLQCDDHFVRVLFARELPGSISDDFFQMLMGVSFHTIITIDVAPIPNEVAQKRLQNLYMENSRSIEKQQEQRNKARAYASEITYDRRRQKGEIENYLDILAENEEKLFYMGLYVTVTAATKKDLDSHVLSLCTTAANHRVELVPALFDQLNALHTCLPVGARHSRAMRPVFTQPLSAFVPFYVQELTDPGGIYYGTNQLSKNFIIGQRKKLKNPHGFVLGTTGAGKGFDVKEELVQVILNTSDDVIVIDPQDEYQVIAKTLKGEFIRISAASNHHINPFDVDRFRNYATIPAFIADKTELMLGVAGQILANEITMGQKSIVGRCVALVYKDYFAAAKKRATQAAPTMVDFYQKLCMQQEPAAKDLKLGFEIFVEGALNTFSKATNVNTRNRFIVYGMDGLGKDLASVGQLLMLENIRARIVENKQKGRATWLYIDEFHNLTKTVFSVIYLEKIWKEVRKLGGICTGITQNINDLLRLKEVETMLCNSDYISLLGQSEVELPILQEVLGLSPNLLKYVKEAAKGCGLLKFGAKYIPRNHVLQKGTLLYKLFNTDFHEQQELLKQQSTQQ
jgi:hypothetical protein